MFSVYAPSYQQEKLKFTSLFKLLQRLSVTYRTQLKPFGRASEKFSSSAYCLIMSTYKTKFLVIPKTLCSLPFSFSYVLCILISSCKSINSPLLCFSSPQLHGHQTKTFLWFRNLLKYYMLFEQFPHLSLS